MANTNVFQHKGDFKGTLIEGGTISAGDIANYIQNEVLGLPVKIGFVTFHGPGRGCSVAMKLCIRRQDICGNVKATSYVDRFLAENSAGAMFKEDVVNKIKPFMYPSDLSTVVRKDPMKAQKLAEIGIAGNNLMEIMAFADFVASPETGYYIIYLDTEKIIVDYLKDPTTDEVDGSIRLATVAGEKDEQIIWEVYITHDGTKGSNRYGILDVSIDKIIATARR